MPTKGVCVVVFSENKRKVLLHKRRDFRIWTVPGGGIEPGETWEAAAVREAYEETGYHIVIDRLVGEYWRRHRGGGLTYVGLGHIVSGEPIEHGAETLEVRWFPCAVLPPRLSPFARIYIQEALSDAPHPIKKTLCIPLHQDLLIRLLFWLRNLRNRLLRRV